MVALETQSSLLIGPDAASPLKVPPGVVLHCVWLLLLLQRFWGLPPALLVPDL